MRCYVAINFVEDIPISIGTVTTDHYGYILDRHDLTITNIKTDLENILTIASRFGVNYFYTFSEREFDFIKLTCSELDSYNTQWLSHNIESVESEFDRIGKAHLARRLNWIYKNLTLSQSEKCVELSYAHRHVLNHTPEQFRA